MEQVYWAIITFNSSLNGNHFFIDLNQIVSRLLGSFLSAHELVGKINLRQMIKFSLNLLELKVSGSLAFQLLHSGSDLFIEQLKKGNIIAIFTCFKTWVPAIKIKYSGDLNTKLRSLVFKWSKIGWMPNGLVFECHLNTKQFNYLNT